MFTCAACKRGCECTHKANLTSKKLLPVVSSLFVYIVYSAQSTIYTREFCMCGKVNINSGMREENCKDFFLKGKGKSLMSSTIYGLMCSNKQIKIFKQQPATNKQLTDIRLNAFLQQPASSIPHLVYSASMYMKVRAILLLSHFHTNTLMLSSYLCLASPIKNYILYFIPACMQTNQEHFISQIYNRK